MRKTSLLLAALLALSIVALPRPSSAQVAIGISVRIGPPPLPVYEQPYCPGPNYIWAPGYWAWSPDGYYWVPGTWVLAPEPGLLWTPGYWGYDDDGDDYVWHPGYWGHHVGYYGGINYGYGYFGVGYVGGEWRHGVFAYNRAVTRVNVTVVRNVYVNRTVIRNVQVNHISYNGGPHGIRVQPTRREREYEHERHFERTAMQERHDTDARRDRSFHYSNNHGRPPVAATSRPGEFHGRNRFDARPDRRDFRPREDYGNRGGQNDRNFSPNAPAHEQGRNFGSAPRENSAPSRQREMSAPRHSARSESRSHNQQRSESGQHNEGSRDRGHGNDGSDHGHDNGHGNGHR
jgi:hypothetical protein